MPIDSPRFHKCYWRRLSLIQRAQYECKNHKTQADMKKVQTREHEVVNKKWIRILRQACTDFHVPFTDFDYQESDTTSSAQQKPARRLLDSTCTSSLHKKCDQQGARQE